MELTKILPRSTTFCSTWYVRQNLEHYENELLINLKPGKTELLLFGTSQRIAKTNKNFLVKFNNKYNNETKSYKYPGVKVDHPLNLNSYFDKTYKRMTLRMKLLNKWRSNMTVSAAASTCNMVIVSLFLYYSLLKTTLTQTQEFCRLNEGRRI